MSDPRDLELDEGLLELVMSSAPPSFALGTVPPPAVLESMPPLEQRRVVSVPPGPGAFVEELVVSGITAVGASPMEPPAPDPTTIERAQGILTDLERTGPGDEAPLVQALMRLGPGVLPAVAAAFPGCLWFDRRLPHRKVARGRDVSAVARAMVAFGPDSAPHLRWLLRSSHADVRFYAVLVAAEIATDGLLEALGRRVLDDDDGVRVVAAAALKGQPLPRTRSSCATLRAVAVNAEEPRPRRLRAIRALAQLRDAEAPAALIGLFSPYDAERSDLVERALTLITGRELGPSPDRWRSWLEAHGDRARIEWLVDALQTDDPLLFSFALAEIEAESGKTFTDHHPDTELARERVRAAARAWLTIR